jgi:hypothetical protein
VGDLTGASWGAKRTEFNQGKVAMLTSHVNLTLNVNYCRVVLPKGPQKDSYTSVNASAGANWFVSWSTKDKEATARILYDVMVLHDPKEPDYIEAEELKRYHFARFQSQDDDWKTYNLVMGLPLSVSPYSFFALSPLVDVLLYRSMLTQNIPTGSAVETYSQQIASQIENELNQYKR